uniref:Uncharacterized protein n=1 Tax=Meloidogyne hapla TaxID=6305 RepID=A0A1I8B0S8_MELHA
MASSGSSSNNSSVNLPSIPESPDPLFDTQTFQGRINLRQLVGQIEERLNTSVISLISGRLSVYTRNPVPDYVDHLVSAAVVIAEERSHYQAIWERDFNVRFSPICEKCEETSLLESEGGIHQSHQICQHISFKRSSNKTTKVSGANKGLRMSGRLSKRSRKDFRLVNNRIRFQVNFSGKIILGCGWVGSSNK